MLKEELKEKELNEEVKEEKELTFLEKVNKIQTELKAPKGQYNSFGKYKYRSCEDIFEALKPLLEKYKLILQTDDELVMIGDRYYIRATATLTNIDGSSISNTSYAREEETKKGMDGSQVTGASSSYARKYALNGLFLIDDTKDSDATNEGQEEKITDKQKEMILSRYQGENLEKLLKVNNLSKIEDMTSKKASDLISNLMKIGK